MAVASTSVVLDSPRQVGRAAGRLWAAVALACSLGMVGALAGPAQARGAGDAGTAFAGGAFDTSVRPTLTQADDALPVELGMRFSSESDALVTGIEFYGGPDNAGPHTGTLWTADGQALARLQFPPTAGEGWRSAVLPDPVAITAGSEYVVSYTAPAGRYAADAGGFDAPLERSGITVPRGGGVYTYTPGTFPDKSYRTMNYYVDVQLTAAPGPPPVVGVPTEPLLSLPVVPWEGGSAYWDQFPRTAAAGWSDPSFFPVAIWFDGISSDAEVQFDKEHGINTYIGMWEGTPYHLFEDNDVFWIGDALNSSFAPDSRNWVGRFLDDEVDGRFTPAAGRAHLRSILDRLPEDGRFRYANFTQMVLGRDMQARDANAFVNDFTDAVSTDMYWYSIPYCDWRPYRDVYLAPVSQATCRTSASYGAMMDSLRQRDAADGELQSLWQFVELLNGGPAEGPFVRHIGPEELKGAVMRSLIHEARGLVYFNQSFSGSCSTGNVMRQAQVLPGSCVAEQVAAAGEINRQVHALAPVLNSPSYVHSFGAGLDTMLKADPDSVYVFAMADPATSAGTRTLRLPPEVSGREVEVLFEDRTLPVTTDGTFQDDFAAEHSYHVYRISR